MTNNWEWWADAIKGNSSPIHDGEPQCGYYRVKRKGHDIDSPVAYWFDTKTGEQRCHMDGADFDEQRALEIWPYASKKPVTEEAYSERLRTGKWPGDNAAVVGHNAAPVEASLAAIEDRIEDLAREAEKLINAGAATENAAADQASDLSNTFAELEKKADKLREEEKAPHLEAGRAVDGKWRAVINRAADLKSRLKRYVVTPFLLKQDEERRKVQIAAVAKGVAPEAAPEVRTTAGSSKRATALRTHKRAEIVDKDVLLAHLKDHPEILAVLQTIADGAARNDIVLPGTKVITEKRAA